MAIIQLIIIINNNNNTQTIFIMAQSHMREFTLDPRSAPGGCQLIAQAANLTLESTCRHLVLLLNHKVYTHLPSLGG